MTPEDDGRRELAGVVQPRPCSCRFYGGGSRAVCAEFGKVLGKVRPADSAPRAHQGAIPAGSDRVRAAGRDGGTGRRAGLKIPCPKGREGSTPSPGTLSPPGATRRSRLDPTYPFPDAAHDERRQHHERRCQRCEGEPHAHRKRGDPMHVRRSACVPVSRRGTVRTHAVV
jgi:hypothetical protein